MNHHFTSYGMFVQDPSPTFIRPNTSTNSYDVLIRDHHGNKKMVSVTEEVAKEQSKQNTIEEFVKGVISRPKKKTPKYQGPPVWTESTGHYHKFNGLLVEYPVVEKPEVTDFMVCTFDMTERFVSVMNPESFTEQLEPGDILRYKSKGGEYHYIRLLKMNTKVGMKIQYEYTPYMMIDSWEVVFHNEAIAPATLWYLIREN